MRKIILLLLLALLVFFFSCKSGNKAGIEEIILEEKSAPANLKLIFEKKVEVPNMQYLILYKTGQEIYIRGYSTEKDKKIIISIYTGDLAFTSQKEFNMGIGPGDLGDGSVIYKCADFIYIPDNTQMRVNIFDKEFNFIKFVSLAKSRFLPITFIKNGEYFLGTHFNAADNGKFTFQSFIVKFPGLTKKQFHTSGPVSPWSSTAEKESRKYVIGAIPEFHYFYKNEKIYFIKMDDYRLSLFDLEGNLLKKVRVNVEKKSISAEEKITWLKEQMPGYSLDRFKLADYIQLAAWMIPLEKGFAVLRRKSYSLECNGLVEADYFDYELNLKGKVEIPCFYRIFELRSGHFTRSFQYDAGYLYVIKEADETFYLEKWQVNEK